jgi:hypothetical protein
MTIHRLMRVIASEQVRLRGDDARETKAAEATAVAVTNDRNDAAAEL